LIKSESNSKRWRSEVVIWGRVFGQALIKSEPKMKSNGGDEKLKDCVNAEDMDPSDPLLQ